jgi:hypothetical protein
MDKIMDIKKKLNKYDKAYLRIATEWGFIMQTETSGRDNCS